jgi:hypothetical protein
MRGWLFLLGLQLKKEQLKQEHNITCWEAIIPSRNSEPKLLAFYTQDADMMAEFDKDDPDLYAQVASMSFDKPYEDCREFYPAGTEITVNGKKVITGYKTHTNKAGKERRTQAKSILLG